MQARTNMKQETTVMNGFELTRLGLSIICVGGAQMN